jgi:hypothetical protein
MSARSRPPTDEPTEVYDSQPRRSKQPTAQGAAPAPRPRTPTARRREALGERVEESATRPSASGSIEQATPTEVVRHDRSEPIRVISMKTPADLEPKQAAKLPVVKLRSLADVTQSQPGLALGRLAPPRDPKEVRARRLRDYVIWGSVVVMLTCVVMLAIWFLARR